LEIHRPRILTQAPTPRAALFDPSGEAPLFDGIDRVKVVFVDGVFDAGNPTTSRWKASKSNGFAMS
jgi:hypothetical protein